MTDNDLRKSRHWRCSQCGSSWPLDRAVCGNPACGADLGIYGQVIEPEPEKPPEQEKKPPSPEDEKPKDEQKKEPKREKPDRAAQKREAREEQKRRKAEAKSRRRAERETDFTASELVRIPHKLMLPLLIAIPLLVYIINSVLLYFVNHFFIMMRRVLIVEYSALLVITLVCVIVTVSRREGRGALKPTLLPPLIFGAAVAVISRFTFGYLTNMISVTSACTGTALALCAAFRRWRQEGRFGSPGKCTAMAVLTTALTLAAVFVAILIAEGAFGNTIPFSLGYIYPYVFSMGCAYVLFLITRRDRIAAVLLLYMIIAVNVFLLVVYRFTPFYFF